MYSRDSLIMLIAGSPRIIYDMVSHLSLINETDTKPTIDPTKKVIKANGQKSVCLEAAWSGFGGVTEVSDTYLNIL